MESFRDTMGNFTKAEKKRILTVVGLIVFVFAILRFDQLLSIGSMLVSILMPVIIGCALAYLMNPIMIFFERVLLNRIRPENKPEKEKSLCRFIRTLSTVLALLVLLAAAAGFALAVLPQFFETLRYLLSHLYEKMIGVIDWADEVTRYRFADVMERTRTDGRIHVWIDTAESWLRSYLHLDDSDDIVSTLTGFGIRVGRLFVNLLIGIFIAIYLLISKESYKGHLKRLIYGTFRVDHANLIMDVIRKADTIFYGFIIGKIIDSIIIGIICFISMKVMRLPYALLCSFIIGVTNIIPVFGPYIGGFPTVVLLFVNHPAHGIIFLIYILILQQVDGNLIGPKILGDSTGTSSFWVIVAIVVGGGLFGFPGMLLGVPTMALILYIVDLIMEHRTEKKMLPTKPEEYESISHIEPGDRSIIRQESKPDMLPGSRVSHFLKNRHPKSQ